MSHFYDDSSLMNRTITYHQYEVLKSYELMYIIQSILKTLHQIDITLYNVIK